MKFSAKKHWPLLALPLTLIAALSARAYLERDPRPVPMAGEPNHIYIPKPDAAPNYSQVEPNLYLGARTDAPPPNTTAVLSLSYYRDLYTATIHQYSSIPDGKPAPTLDWLQQQVAFVDTQQKANRLTYIHCDAGVSRSAMVTAAYLMYEHHWTRDQSLAYLREKRPVIAPNTDFTDLLLDYEKQLANQNP